MAGGGKRRRLSKSCALLIVIAGIERYAFKGVASNLVTYLTDVVKMSNSRAATTVNTWSGFTFMLPLFSAPFADYYGDRFFTILASSSLYFVVSITKPTFRKSRFKFFRLTISSILKYICLIWSLIKWSLSFFITSSPFYLYVYFCKSINFLRIRV